MVETPPAPVTITVSSPAELRPLRELLRGVRGADVTQVPGAPASGQLGATEVLQVIVPTAAVLAIVIRVIPEFIRSRRSSVTVTVERRGRTVTVTAENVTDPQGIINRLLDDA
jgi:hypothetical protein